MKTLFYSTPGVLQIRTLAGQFQVEMKRCALSGEIRIGGARRLRQSNCDVTVKPSAKFSAEAQVATTPANDSAELAFVSRKEGGGDGSEPPGEDVTLHLKTYDRQGHLFDDQVGINRGLRTLDAEPRREYRGAATADRYDGPAPVPAVRLRSYSDTREETKRKEPLRHDTKHRLRRTRFRDEEVTSDGTE